MFAIVEAGRKQIRVEEGQEILVDSLQGKAGETVIWDKVLLLHQNQEQPQIGRPYVPGAKVEGVLMDTESGEKIRVFKYKPKKRYRKTIGHRQQYRRIHIKKITSGGAS